MVLFLLKAVGEVELFTENSMSCLGISGEYIRLAYRSVNPRPLRDVSGDVVLVTGAGGRYPLALIGTTESSYGHHHLALLTSWV